MRKRKRMTMGTGMEMETKTETDMEMTTTENDDVERWQDPPPDLQAPAREVDCWWCQLTTRQW